MVFVLSRYNGGPDDPSVTVALYLSPGFEGRRLDGGIGDAGESSPLFDGTDRWTISPTSLIGGSTLVGTDCETATTCAPLYVDSDAYVTGGTLVAHLDFPIGVSDRFVLLVSSATVTGTLQRQGASARLQGGQVSGRASAENILSGMGLLQDPFSSDYLCKNNPTYLNVKQTLCASADVATDPRLDNTGAPCDALAAASDFGKGEPAKPPPVTYSWIKIESMFGSRRPMRVVPVLDIKNGRAVHAVQGKRAHYGPLRSVLHGSDDPIGIASA